MAWSKIFFLTVLYIGCPVLFYNSHVQASPIEGLSTPPHDLAISSSTLVSRTRKVKRTIADLLANPFTHSSDDPNADDDLANVNEDTIHNTNVEMYDTIGIDLKTGQWQKIHSNYNKAGKKIDVKAATEKPWTEFSGVREGSSSDWLKFSQSLWDNVLTTTGVADVKNLGAFGLLKSTGVLLASSEYAILSQIGSGYGFDIDTNLPTNYIDTISRLQIEVLNAMIAKNAAKLQGAKIIASKPGERSDSQEWSAIVKYIATPRGIPSSDVTWVTYDTPHGNGLPLIPDNTGAKMLFKGEDMKLYTREHSAAKTVATDIRVANEPVARLPVVEARPAPYVKPLARTYFGGGGGFRWSGAS